MRQVIKKNSEKSNKVRQSPVSFYDCEYFLKLCQNYYLEL